MRPSASSAVAGRSGADRGTPRDARRRREPPRRAGRGVRCRALASADAAQWLSLALVAAAAVFADQVTKHIVSSQLALDDEIEIVGPFSIHHVQNSGIAFGLFSERDGRRHRHHGRRGRLDALLLRARRRAPPGAARRARPVIGGSVSNLVDRVRLGHVTDFLDLRWWPAFNLADMCIVVGVVMLLGDDARRRAKPTSAPGRRDVAPDLAARTGDAAGLRLDRYLVRAGGDRLARRPPSG